VIPFKGIWPLNHHLVLSVGRLARLLYDFRDHSDLCENWFCTPISHGTSSLRALLPGFKHTKIIVLVLYVYIVLYPIICPSCRVPHYAPTWGWACSPNQLHQFSLSLSLSLHSLETPWKGVSKNRNFISLPLSIRNRICLMKFPSWWTKTTPEETHRLILRFLVNSPCFWKQSHPTSWRENENPNPMAYHNHE